LRARDPKLKQGSQETAVDNSIFLSAEIREHCDGMVNFYEHLLEHNVAPEIARCVLPQGMYTEFVETGSLAAYARLVGLRTDPTAQREIQAYAHGIVQLLQPHFPISWKALTV
jgi:thymidylate synthase (FAD)